MLPGKLKTSSARKIRLPEGYRRFKNRQQKHAVLFVAAMIPEWRWRDWMNSKLRGTARWDEPISPEGDAREAMILLEYLAS